MGLLSHLLHNFGQFRETRREKDNHVSIGSCCCIICIALQCAVKADVGLNFSILNMSLILPLLSDYGQEGGRKHLRCTWVLAHNSMSLSMCVGSWLNESVNKSAISHSISHSKAKQMRSTLVLVHYSTSQSISQLTSYSWAEQLSSTLVLTDGWWACYHNIGQHRPLLLK